MKRGTFNGKTHSEETKTQMSLSHIGKHFGEKNSQYGSKWVRNGSEVKKIGKDQLETYLSNGWVIGRVETKAKQKSKSDLKYELVCIQCESPFRWYRKKETCSEICAKKLTGSRAAKTMKVRGTFSGWHNRKGERSYPEHYFEDVFKNEGITGWIPDKKVGRWFIDFAFNDKMIALEIDGKQHKYPDRAESDRLKDEYLKSQGWKVIRVDWFNPRTEDGRDKLHPQVKQVLSLLR